jgi:hypothetical protein
MIEITEVNKILQKKGDKFSLYRVTYRANGNLLWQDMNLNNELPDEIFIKNLAHIAEHHLIQHAPKAPQARSESDG